MDTYQAIYDAVRSRITNGDIGSVIEQVARESFDVSIKMEVIAQEWIIAAHEQMRPSVLHKPVISLDGDQYCALLGENLMEGVAGFGSTVAEAFLDFDRNFENSLAPSQAKTT